MTVNNGEKMSKSRGTGLDPLKYLGLQMNPEWLRYYLGAKLNGKNEDIDFNPDDFMARVNSDLIGKYVNIASRAAGFIAKRFDGKLGTVSEDGQALLAQLRGQSEAVVQAFENRDTARAVREIMQLCDRVNEYVDANKPWELAKQEGMDARLQDVCTTCIEAFRLLTIYLKPILPAVAEQVEGFLNVAPLQFADAQNLLGAGHAIGLYKHLMQRVDVKQLEALFEAPSPWSRRSCPAARKLPKPSASTTSPRWTCASPRSWNASPWKARPSCCSSRWTWAKARHATCSPASPACTSPSSCRASSP